MSTPARELGRVQRWMQAVVTHPAGVDAGLRSAPARRWIPEAAENLEAVVLPSRSLGAAERLGIYAWMYYARLVEVLEEEYPTTRKILGDEIFDRACRRYIDRHPSTGRTLQCMSADFPAFLSRHLRGDARRLVACDVARIERAMEDVFDAPMAEPLTHEQVSAVGPDQWATARLVLNPALRLLTLRTPANDVMNALRSRKRLRKLEPRVSHVLVHRHRYRIYRNGLDPTQFALLSTLQGGRPLAASVAVALRHCRGEPVRLRAKLGRWFRDWTAAGLFVGLSSEPIEADSGDGAGALGPALKLS